MHELCLKAWAMSPSPRMLDAGNDYYTCSKCGEKTSPPKPSKPIELDRLDEILTAVFNEGMAYQVSSLKDYKDLEFMSVKSAKQAAEARAQIARMVGL